MDQRLLLTPLVARELISDKGIRHLLQSGIKSLAERDQHLGLYRLRYPHLRPGLAGVEDRQQRSCCDGIEARRAGEELSQLTALTAEKTCERYLGEIESPRC